MPTIISGTEILVHVAGPPDRDGRQRCLRCDIVILNAKEESRTWYAVGALVAIGLGGSHDGRRYVKDRRELRGVEAACEPVPVVLL